MGMFSNVSKGSNREPLAPGMYKARLIRIIGVGKQEKKSKQFGDKVVDQLAFFFETPEATIEIDGQSLPRIEMLTVTRSLHEKAKLPKLLKDIDPTAKLTSSFDEKSLLGKAVTLVIGDSGFIDQIIPDVAGMDIPDPVASVYSFDFTDPDEEVFKQLTKGMRNWMARALNYNGSKVERLAEKFPLEENTGAVKSDIM